MNKVGKVIISMLILVLVVTSLVPTASASAETKKVTDTQLKKVMKCYKNILSTNPYDGIDGGFTAETFLLKDLDKDGIPELIINGEVPQIFSYDLKNDKEMFLYNSWVYCTLYYSSKAKTIMYTYEWKGKKDWMFYEVNNTQENDASSVLKSLEDYYSYTDGKYEEYDSCTVKEGYYKGYYNNEDSKKITKETIDKAIEKFVPEKIKLETTIKNTKANRSKYLGSLKQFKKYSSK